MKNYLSIIGAVLISITYFPIHVMNSGLSVSEFITANPVFKIPGLMSLIGFIVFGIAIIRIIYFPAWTGVIIGLGSIIYAIAMAMELQFVVNINNIFISLIVIYM